MGRAFIEQEVTSPVDGVHTVVRQQTQLGSFLTVSDPRGYLNLEGAFTLWAYVWPTTPEKGRQGLLTRWSESDNQGYALGLGQSGKLELRVGDGQRVESLEVEQPLAARQWYFVAASFDPRTQEATVYQKPVVNRYSNLLSQVAGVAEAGDKSGPLAVCPAAAGCDFLWAGYHDSDGERGMHVAGLFNGKIDRSGVVGKALGRRELDLLSRDVPPPVEECIAKWDTTAGYTHNGIGDQVLDQGPNKLHATGYNRPVRAATGYNWNGRDDCFRLAPEQFGGIWFHDDAIIDCCWEPSFEMTVPHLKSGVYAARLRAGDVEDHLVFFVRPLEPSAAIAMLIPTCTYLAYANERLGLSYPTTQVVNGRVPIFHEWDLELAARPEYGSSTYDLHSDGAGICYSSHLRPVFNMRPRHRMAGTVVP